MRKLPSLGDAGWAHVVAALGFIVSLITLVVGLLTWRSLGLDNDLWYHLTGGRYILSNWEIPREAFFSFLEPPRAWTDYNWLFQAVAYSFQRVLGSYGLVLLRAGAFLGVLSLSLALLEHRRRGQAGGGHGVSVVPAVILLFYALALLPRFATVWPHTLTLLALALCIFLLECRPEKAWLLPLVTLVWTNLHGIAYPIMVLVVGSYVAEGVLTRISRKQAWARKETIGQLWKIAAMATIVATPFGFRLLAMPFRSTEVASQYILEIRSVDPFTLLQWSVGPEGIGPQTALNLVRAFVLIAVIALAVHRQLRISHALLIAGGVMLLIKGARFEYYLLLLALPAVATVAARWDAPLRFRRGVAVAACLLALAGAFSIHAYFRDQAEQVVPYGAHGAPRGVANFLESEGEGGRILHHPNLGGYLAWRLHPRFQITADMQTPFVFTDTDIFHSVKMFNNELLLRRQLVEYRPDYIVAPLGNFGFARYMTESTPYVPVFFDEISALYVHRETRPEVVGRFTLRRLSLTENLLTQVSSLDQEQLEPVIQENERMLEVDPDGGLLHLLAAKLYLRAGSLDEAERHASRALARLRGSSHAHAAAADVDYARERWRNAARGYRRAVEHSATGGRARLYRKLARSHSRLGEHRRAYRAMLKAVNLLAADTNQADLYELALAARRAGKEADAREYLRFAYLQTPPGDTQWRRRIQQALGDDVSLED
jgi:tetratricopeptide (TPR) repeat protein